MPRSIRLADPGAEGDCPDSEQQSASGQHAEQRAQGAKRIESARGSRPSTTRETRPGTIEQTPGAVRKKNGRRACDNERRRWVPSDDGGNGRCAKRDIETETARGSGAGPVREKLEQAGIRPEYRENHHENNISPRRAFRQMELLRGFFFRLYAVLNDVPGLE